MRKHLFAGVLAILLPILAQAETTNIALTCSNVSASYTSSWNNLSAVNNGTKGFGMDLANNETWGCYISTAGNKAQQTITYTWGLTQRMESSSLYLWSDCQSGSGVAVPESWRLEYLTAEGEWQPVTLLDGEEYTCERFDVNSVKFEPVESKSIRLVLNAQLNGQYYSAMGVNEWEVYGECIEKEEIDPAAKINVATMTSSMEASYTSSWNNLYSINNGVKDTGDQLSNNETWGCYISESGNMEQQTLVYWWNEEYNVDSVAVYFWTNVESGNGVAMPQSWSIEYYVGEDNWQPVTLLDGESYGVERLEPNHVKFAPVSTLGLRLVLNAQPYSNYYSAMAVDEWEVYSADMSYAEKLMMQYQALVEEITDYVDYSLSDYEALADYVYEALDENQLDDEEQDIEKIQHAIDALNQVYAEAKTASTQCAEILSTILKIGVLLESDTQYPGYDDLVATYETAISFMDDGYGTPAQVSAVYEEVAGAIDKYRFSQIASADDPADYSFLGKNFQFISEEAAPTFDEETGSYDYPNAGSYTEGDAPSDSRMSGWYLGETDGTQTVKWYRGRMCWYANKTACNELSISQNLKNLPDGYYAVSAEMITNEEGLSNQHVFAKTSAGSVVSESLSIPGWDYGEGEWTRLTTEKIHVFDGKLTIGAAASGDNLTNKGMFAATNFILYYYGKADAENIDQLYADKIAECQAQCDTMHYAADLAAYQNKIDENKSAQGFDDINTALKALNAAQIVAERSENTYAKFLVGSYATLNEAIANEEYKDEALAAAKGFVAQVDKANAAPSATYKNAATITALITYMMDNYMPAIQEAIQASCSDAEVMTALQQTIKSQVSYFENNELGTTDKLDELIDMLQQVVNMVKISQTMASGGTDYTPVIRNAGIDNVSATAWDIDENTGNTPVKSGQHYDGQSGYYLDSYAAGLQFTASQTITNVPNGTYKLRAMMRSDAQPGVEGCYLFAVADDDVEGMILAPSHVKLHDYSYYNSITTEDGSDSLAYVSNTYGDVWEEATDWLWNDASLDDAQYDYYTNIHNANKQNGWGWNYVEMTVEVKEHKLRLGVTCSDTFTAGHTDTEGNAAVSFSGTWMSADNFTLTLLNKGDNEGWSPATAVEHVGASDASIVAIYNVAGMRVAANAKGLVIRRMSDGSVKKYLK